MLFLVFNLKFASKKYLNENKHMCVISSQRISTFFKHPYIINYSYLYISALDEYFQKIRRKTTKKRNKHTRRTSILTHLTKSTRKTNLKLIKKFLETH